MYISVTHILVHCKSASVRFGLPSAGAFLDAFLDNSFVNMGDTFTKTKIASSNPLWKIRNQDSRKSDKSQSLLIGEKFAASKIWVAKVSCSFYYSRKNFKKIRCPVEWAFKEWKIIITSV